MLTSLVGLSGWMTRGNGQGRGSCTRNHLRPRQVCSYTHPSLIVFVRVEVPVVVL